MSQASMQPVHEGLFTPSGLTGGACSRCNGRQFPASATCQWCGSDGVSKVTLSTEGILWAWTAVSAAPPGYEGAVPYGFGIVELPADGLRVVTRLTEADPSRLTEGMPMRFTLVPLTDTTTTWAFGPA